MESSGFSFFAVRRCCLPHIVDSSLCAQILRYRRKRFTRTMLSKPVCAQGVYIPLYKARIRWKSENKNQSSNYFHIFTVVVLRRLWPRPLPLTTTFLPSCNHRKKRAAATSLLFRSIHLARCSKVLLYLFYFFLSTLADNARIISHKNLTQELFLPLFFLFFLLLVVVIQAFLASPSLVSNPRTSGGCIKWGKREKKKCTGV